MKARMRLTAEQQTAVNREIKRYLNEMYDGYAKDIDCIYLVALHNQFGFGAKRLKKFWESVLAATMEYRKNYMADGAEELGFAARRELKHIGVDIDEWYREYERKAHR